MINITIISSFPGWETQRTPGRTISGLDVLETQLEKTWTIVKLANKNFNFSYQCLIQRGYL